MLPENINYIFVALYNCLILENVTIEQFAPNNNIKTMFQETSSKPTVPSVQN